MKKGKIDLGGFWIQMVWQILAILVLATVLGIMGNFFREERLSLKKDWSSDFPAPGGADTISEISFEEAREAFLSDTTVFLDARAPLTYREGHIQGARNLPWESVEKLADGVMADFPPDTKIITYCDGKNCDLSRNLAKALFFRGYERVGILVNGWSLWKEAELPISQGDNP